MDMDVSIAGAREPASMLYYDGLVNSNDSNGTVRPAHDGSPRRKGLSLANGIAIGVAIGAGLGVAMNNIPVGVSFGIGIGIAISLATGAVRGRS
jgi:hypothetical protein